MPPALPLPLQIIEPTLSGVAGHCLSLVRALVDAAPERDITVWAGRGAAAVWQPPGRLQALFHRRWRRLQALWLMRRLLRRPGPILVATAGTSDLVIADWAATLAATGRIAPHQLYLFVHWLGGKPGKAQRLSAIARRQPHIEILAPTPAVVDFFAGCGFPATLVPYPLAPSVTSNSPPGFRHLLVAGGARLDKGFAEVVDLVAALQQRGLLWPITVQISSEDRHRNDPVLLEHITRLRSLGYAGLVLQATTLDPAAYRALFDGAVVLQPYRAQDFQSRVSGVTLDALAAGAPVVVTAGTWMADLVQRFGAGVATADLSAAGLIQAIESVLARHAQLANQAKAAAATVLAEHSARRLLDVVLRRT